MRSNASLRQRNPAQMETGLLAVQDLLGPQSETTDKEIRDALWNYYFDVEKASQFLLGKRISSNGCPDLALTPKQINNTRRRQPRLAKPVSCFLELRSAAPLPFDRSLREHQVVYFFRPTLLSDEVGRPSLAALAFQTSKPKSSLASLAAARKDAGSLPSTSIMAPKPSALSKLAAKRTQNQSLVSSQKSTGAAPQKISKLQMRMQGLLLDKSDGASSVPPQDRPAEDDLEDVLPPSELFSVPGSKPPFASPSGFAAVISTSCSPLSSPLQFLMANLSLGPESPALTGPSPDDVILKAREKSSLRTRPRP
jgi:elongation factor 1 alpha-like protein